MLDLQACGADVQARREFLYIDISIVEVCIFNRLEQGPKQSKQWLSILASVRRPTHLTVTTF
jgi:hypothetical protein